MIINTIDGGENWVEQNTNIRKELYSIHFVNELVGWVAGSRIILYTSDGGENWVEQNSNINTHLRSVFFIDSLCGWVVGHEGNIINTIDGGENWNKYVIESLNEDLYELFFYDTKKGWITGDNGLILYTSDGGKNWNEQYTGTKNELHNIFFIDSLNGWAVGEDGTILHTTTGGITSVEDELLFGSNISQCYPNPFSDYTIINYKLLKAGNVSLKVFDMYGNEIAILADEYQAEGIHTRRFDPTKLSDDLAQGVYFYRLQTPGGTETGKLVLVK